MTKATPLLGFLRALERQGFVLRRRPDGSIILNRQHYREVMSRRQR